MFKDKSHDSENSGAMAGLRIVDLSRVLAGPYCTQILADHGATVLKIEPPQGDETRALGPPFIGDAAAYYWGINRNKLGVALDLSAPSGRDVLCRLLEDADVLVENFLPGTMEKWNLGYAEVLKNRFPRLVYCQISGFGTGGPLGGLPGYDAVLQALCGLMSINGTKESGPTRIGVPIVDLATGLHATIGILLALAERVRSGRGQFVECCLYDTALSLLQPHASNWFASGRVPALTGNAHPNISPYDTFQACDGNIFVGILNEKQFNRFCTVIERADLPADERFASNASRLANQESLRQEIETHISTRSATDICTRLMAAGVPAATVSSIPMAMEHPHTRFRSMSVQLGEYKGLGVNVKLSRTSGSVRFPPPQFGADTSRVLSAAGFNEEEVDLLFREGVALSGAVRKRVLPAN